MIQDHSGDIPYTLTHPMQDARFVQPTLGRIAVGVFVGNLMTGVVGGIIWFLASMGS